MSWRRRREPDRQPVPAAAEPAPADSDVELVDADLHFCCICGAPLGFDQEDEIDGEGRGRDICGACNRTRNFDMQMGW